MRVWTKWDLPYRLHSVKSNRIPSLVLDLDVNWETDFGGQSAASRSNGDHGWDNLYRDMHAIFVAIGPSFQSRLSVQPFENVQLYNLMCLLTNATPAANNGTWGALHHLLADPPAPLDSQDAADADADAATPQVLAFPADQETYRLIMSNRSCSTADVGNSSTWQADQHLVKSDRDVERLLQTHAPLGLPTGRQLPADGRNPLRLLIQDDFVTVFDQDLGRPQWTAYAVAGWRNGSEERGWRFDGRLSGDDAVAICRRQRSGDVNHQSIVNLFPAEFAGAADEPSASDAWLETNAVQMTPAAAHLRHAMVQLLAETWTRVGPIYVISGVVRSPPYPSMFYVVIRCTDEPQEAQEETADHPLARCATADALDVQSFLLPTAPRWNAGCINDRRFIAYHVASLNDVERVTGLHLFPRLSSEAKVELLTRTTLASRLVVDPTRFPADPQ